MKGLRIAVRELSVQARFLQFMEEFGAADNVIVILEGDQQRIRDLAPAVAAEIGAQRSWVKSVFYRVDLELFKKHALYYVPLDQLQRLEDFLPQIERLVLSGDGPHDLAGFLEIVRRGFGESADSVLQGITITGGYAKNGGGIYIDHSGPTVANCTFAGNRGRRGGGMYNAYADGRVVRCTFTGNTAENGGGGIGIVLDSEMSVVNCTFTGNTADVGGGIFIFSRYLTVVNCTFTGNSALAGGAIQSFGNLNK